MEQDGLLPPVGDDYHEWLRPQLEGEADRDEVIAAYATWMVDIQQMLQVVWPAAVDGELRRPPDAHIVDGLVRRWIIDNTDNPELIAEVSLRPQARTIAVMSDDLPRCTECAAEGVDRDARYDSGYTSNPNGPWTFLCGEHFNELGPARLGNGVGQYLVTWEELGPQARSAFIRARQYWAARGVALPDWLPWDS
jgi:hypothetical protein